MSTVRARSTPERINESLAVQTASDLPFKGLARPSGCTEPLLHRWRLKVKKPFALS